MKRVFETALYVVMCVMLMSVLLTVIIIFVKKSKPRVLSNTLPAFALLTRLPDWQWLEFLRTFTSTYTVHVFVDDNTVDLSKEREAFPDYKFVQILDKETAAAGYKNSSYIITPNPIAWDKALYYFQRIAPIHETVWFCEDDVYIRSVDQLANMDAAHVTADLLCERNTCVHKPSGKWHWPQVWGKLDLPWCGSMVCLCRVSKKLLAKVDAYVRKHGQLDFLEVLLPTLAVGMEVASPRALATMTYKSAWNKETVRKDQIYHPFKNVSEHVYMRNQ